jgi:outer membrane protein TolC
MLIISRAASAQSPVLDRYIQDAFAHNQALQQQNFQLEKSLYALKEAQALFMPQVSLQGSYTKASGGRTIDIPIGDLMNPVHNTLNQLTNSKQFPQLSNQSILLSPDNFYDAKVRTSLPLINTEIWYAKKIRQEDIGRQQAAVNVYKRQLVKDIKTAYYQYVQAMRAVDIYQNALLLVEENIRVNRSMLQNGIRNSTSLTRAQTEKERTEASITQARNNQQNAQSYFNFLLNRSLTADISIDSTALALTAGFPSPETTTVTNREELVQLDKSRSMALLQQKLHRSTFIPKLSTFLDLGSQAYNWDFNNKSRYYLWGVNLQWDIFSGGQRRYRERQAATDAAIAKAAIDETTQALQLEQRNAFNNHQTATTNYKSAQTQLQLAEKYYRDQLKVYKEGQLLYIELLDAQNQLTNARLQLLQASAQVQIATAEIERAQASYAL